MMKPTLQTALLFALFATSVLSQSAFASDFSSAGYEAAARGPHSTRWSRLQLQTNLDGTISIRTNSFIQLATGLNRRQGTHWVEAAPELVATNSGIIGRGAAHAAFFGNNAVVQVRMPNGQLIKTRFLGISYHDTFLQTNILIAELKDPLPMPQILGSNQVVWQDAFEGAAADLTYFYDRTGVRQDVVIRAQLPRPQEFGLHPQSVHVLAISEVLEAPLPTKRDRPWPAGPEILHDETIDFGSSMRMIAGRAFQIQGAFHRRGQGIRVAKTFETLGDRRFIVERLRYPALRRELRQLPPSLIITNAADGSITNAALNPVGRWYAQGTFPRPTTTTKLAATSTARPTRTLSLADRPGFVWDWNLVPSDTDASLYPGTYVVSGDCHVNNLSFNSDPTSRIVVKYQNDSSLSVDGDFSWIGSGLPAILTSVYDDAYGEPIGIEDFQPDTRYWDYGPALLVQASDLPAAQEHLVALYADPGIIPYGLPSVSISASDPTATKGSNPADTASFTISRGECDWSSPLTVHFAISGTAGLGTDYQTIDAFAVIPANVGTTDVIIAPGTPGGTLAISTVILTLQSDPAYSLGTPQEATVYIDDPAAPVPAAPSPSGLIAWWRAEDNALDSYGGLNGSVVGGLTYAAGEVDRAFYFNGTDARVNVPAADQNSPLNFHAGDDFSIEGWLYPISASTTWGIQSVVDKRIAPSSNDRAVGYEICLVYGKLAVQLADNPLEPYHFSSYPATGPDLRDSRWHHFAVTVDRDSASGLKIYVDGALVSPTYDPTSESGDLWNDQPFRIGNHANIYLNANFKGPIDEVAVYSRVLSLEEIQAIFNAGPRGKAIPPAITTQPEGQIVLQNSSATFTVAATGTAPLTYQWRFNGVDISGAIDSAYTISSAQPADAGKYTVLVANPCCSVLSAEASLLVVPTSGFFAGINLGGDDQVTIDGHPWWAHSQAVANGLAIAGDNPSIYPIRTESRSYAFELVPAPDPDTAKMLRSMVRLYRVPPLGDPEAHPLFNYYNPNPNGNPYDLVKVGGLPGSGYGYIVHNTGSAYDYSGWCMKFGTTNQGGIDYNCNFFYTYGPTLTRFPNETLNQGQLKRETLNKINYILNNKQGNAHDVQNAVWTVAGSDPYFDLTDEYWAMIAAAEAEGATFVPTAEDIAVVIADAGPGLEPLGLEVPVIPTGFTLTQRHLPNYDYNIYLWLLENEESNVRSLNIKVQNVEVATGAGIDLALGHWQKLGPYPATVTDGTLTVQISSPVQGDPMIMGLEISTGAPNTPPTIAVGPPVTYQVGSDCLFIAPTASITDQETTQDDPSFSATLRVAVAGNADADDRLDIASENGVSVSPEGALSFQGSPVGQIVSPGAGATPLAFTVYAPLTTVAALLRNITFHNISPRPSRLARTIQFTAREDTGTEDSTPATKLVTISAPNCPPIVEAGRDRTITKPSGGNAVATMEGFVADDGLPGTPLDIYWTVLEKPAGATCSIPDPSPTAQATFSATGRYVLQLAADDGAEAISDTVTIRVCEGHRRPKDVLLVLDRFGESGVILPQFMHQRAVAFTDFLEGNDQAGLVVFSDDVNLQHVLTPDRAVVRNSTVSQEGHQTSNLGRAIRVAHAELTSLRANPTADKVMLLFALGVANDLEDAQRAAVSAKAAGIRIITIGIFPGGAPPDSDPRVELLKFIASSPTDYRVLTDTATDWTTAYAAMAEIFVPITDAFCDSPRLEVHAGSDQWFVPQPGTDHQVNVEAAATGGHAPVSYEWTFVKDGSLPTAIAENEVEVPPGSGAIRNITIHGPREAGLYLLRVTATDSSGVVGQDDLLVHVSSAPMDQFFAVEKQSSFNTIDVLQHLPNLASYHLVPFNYPETHGTVETTPDGRQLLYTPDPISGGRVNTIYYTINDAMENPLLDPRTGQTFEGKVSIFVRPVNEAPMANPDNYTFPVDSGLHYLDSGGGTGHEISVLANDHDPDWGEQNGRYGGNPYNLYPFPIIAVSQPLHGTTSIQPSDGQILFQADTGFCGQDSFTYTVRDTYGIMATGLVTVVIGDDPDLLGYHAREDAALLSDGQASIAIDVLLNDKEHSYDYIPLTIEAVTQPSQHTGQTVAIEHSEALLRDVLVYTPPMEYDRQTPVTFSYTIPGGNGPKYTADVTVGFAAGGTPSGRISNLDPPESSPSAVFVTRKGILEVQGQATSSSARAAVVYRLRAFRTDNDNLVQEATYVNRVDSTGTLGYLDLTQVPNGGYRIELWVTDDGDLDDSSSNVLADQKQILLESDLKIGRFTLSEVDLQIPVRGVPLVLTRNYDSFDVSSGEFGHAWRLSVGAGELIKSGALGADWLGTTESGQNCIRENGKHWVKIKLANGKELNFQARATMGEGGPSCYSGQQPAAFIVFDPLPGTVGTLAILNQPEDLEMWPDDGEWSGRIDIHRIDGMQNPTYDADEFAYTDPSGTVYNFSDGHVISIHDANNNQLRFDFDGVGTDGIYYTPAVGQETMLVKVQRNGPSGPITKIWAPNELRPSEGPPTIVYEYDTFYDPRLVRVNRLVDKTTGGTPVYRTTAYFYELSFPSVTYSYHITRIVGPNGAIRNEYDEGGRLIATIDPQGNRTEFDHNDGRTLFLSGAAVGRETIKDPLGHTTIHEYDACGNIVLTRDPLDHDIARSYTYDSHDRKESETTTERVDAEHERTVTREFDFFDGSTSDQIESITETRQIDGSSSIQTKSIFNNRGQLSNFADPNHFGDTTPGHAKYGYVEPDDPEVIAHPEWYVHALGRIKTTTDPMGNETTFKYVDGDHDGRAELEIQLDPRKNKTESVLNEFGYVTEVNVWTNSGTLDVPIHNICVSSTKYTYDENGQQESVLTTRITPSDSGDVEVGMKQEFIRDATGALLRTLVWTNTDGGTFYEFPSPSPEVVYDEAGQPKTQTTRRTRLDGSVEINTTRFTYDQRGNVTRTTYPDGTFDGSVFDAAGRRIQSVDRLGRTNSFVYDDASRLTSALSPDGTQTSTEYDEAGRVVASRDARGLRTSYAYDEADRRTWVTNAEMRAFQYQYDPSGNLRYVTDPLQRTTEYRYDDNNRRTHVAYPGDSTEVTLYDDQGRRVQVTDRDGVITQFGYDVEGRLLVVTNAVGTPEETETRYTYDEAGNLTEQKDALGRVTKFEYDALGRRIKRTLPGIDQPETFSYNEVGNLTSHIDFNQKETLFEYDNLGRLTNKAPDISGVDPIVFTYNAAGLRTKMKYPLGPGQGSDEVTYKYDLANNRLWRKIAPQGTITYGYDDAGNLTSITTDHGTTVTNGFDVLNRLTVVTENPFADPKTTVYRYDELGNLHECLYTNGISTIYSYNALNHLRRVRSAFDDTLIANFDYDEAGDASLAAAPAGTWGTRLLSASGRRNRVLETIRDLPQNIVRMVDYDYDHLNRLTQETVGSGSIRYDGLTPLNGSGPDLPGFDLVGNRRSRRSTVGGVASTPAQVYFDLADRLDNDTAAETPSTWFDANGNTLKPDLNGDGVVDATEEAYTYTYDFENRLVSAVGGGKTIAMVYDGDGNRVKKTVNGVDTHYLVDDHNLTGYAQVLEELPTLENPTPTARYVYGLDLISQTRGTDRKFFGYDGLGTTRYLSDESGLITDTYTYDAFGILIERRAWHSAQEALLAFDDPSSEIGPAGTEPTPNFYRYTGEQWDPDLRAYYLRARYYSPQIGRFWTMDSFEGRSQDPLSLHKYLYANSRPVDGTDASGHEFTLVSLQIAAAVGMALEFSYNEVIVGTGFNIMGVLTEIQAGQTMDAISTEMMLDMREIIRADNFIDDLFSFAMASAGVSWADILPSGWTPVVGSGNAYSVAFQAQLPPENVRAKNRAAHFKKMNELLLARMDADTGFSRVVETLIPDIRSQLRGPKGGISVEPPKNWQWHHNAKTGVLELVPKIQHTSGGKLYTLFHGGENGRGWVRWGKIR